MSNTQKKFLKDAERVAFDLKHRKTIKFNISRYDAAVQTGKKQWGDLEKAKYTASAIKQKVLEHLPWYLNEFEKNFAARGGHVIWAQNSDQAIEYISEILARVNARLVVKSKSMTTEEIHFNESVEKLGIESLETDLGEFIVQVAGERPYHIITPAMHKSKEDIAKLFHEKFQTPANYSPEQITGFVRELLRKKYLDADVGVSGANFLIADTGSIAVTENEGNAFMSVSFPKIHIAIAGIEKILPSLKDLGLFWPLLATHGTGQKISVYSNLISGPKQAGETDGPEEMYVILLDNNRSHLFSKPSQKQSLLCIRCGACLNVCPVYRNIGGYTYNTTYSGPIGSVITPHLRGLKEYKHLSFASSLCGKCTEVCPVKIELHRLLLYNRNEAVINGYSPTAEKVFISSFRWMMLDRKRLELLGPGIKNMGLQFAGRGLWGPRRKLPIFTKSFKKQWMFKNKIDADQH